MFRALPRLSAAVVRAVVRHRFPWALLIDRHGWEPADGAGGAGPPKDQKNDEKWPDWRQAFPPYRRDLRGGGRSLRMQSASRYTAAEIDWMIDLPQQLVRVAGSMDRNVSEIE